MKSSAYQFICVVIHVVTSSHYVCLISASCAMPGPIDNTIITLPNQTLDTGSYITWECSDGYRMGGLTNTVVWVCLEDRSWMGHTPICTDVECPSPPIAAYSELDPPLPEAPVVNQTISYTCSSSEYTLLGSSLNRCLQDGTWENDPPVCQRTCSKDSDSTTRTERYSNLTCYRGRLGPSDWEASLNLCNDSGEILATVKDAQTQEFLVMFLKRYNFWIGAREGRDWKWKNSKKQEMSIHWVLACLNRMAGVI
ncbi:sushi, von Willebrand factor type A, EGF and pentraxin domain-containing protein 1-like [Strongylocentrotus purpuratus]|uniref:Uncharacterized protein n=1 Tax=Strongylocentrotus purpuratus TaxID=7668 RepID=A0A7M7N9N3_STRPU|nr:sushi, von Willebrand factor type A, EGF and pentraxin domain-containing protein 1-like [Strongylocentrotus purpuratus]